MKKIVTYFSASGVTEKAAEELAAAAGADIHEIMPVHPYTEEDLDWRTGKSRRAIEMKDQNSRPDIATPLPDLSAYDTVYIGFPVWRGVAPRIINTFIESNDLEGKRIIIFATSGGSGMTSVMKDLQKRYPGLHLECGGLIHGKVTKDLI